MEVGHYVEVVAGEHKGKRGVVAGLDRGVHRRKPKIAFDDGTETGLSGLEPDKLRSSGLGKTAFLAGAMAAGCYEVRSACARLSPPMRDAVDEVGRRVRRDELPLLSLLQADPLQLQSSHLTFQEYFAARAICEGAHLSGAKPWQWPAWWANAVKVGSKMDGFGKALLRASGEEDDSHSLDLSGKLDGSSAVAVEAVAQMMPYLTEIKCVGEPSQSP